MPGDSRGHERNARLERDARCSRAPTRLARLAKPFPPPRSLGEHDDGVAAARERDGGRDRLVVLLAAAHAKAAGCLDEGAQRKPEELGLRHEAKEAAREERHRERPGVEVRPVVRREHETAGRRHVLDTRRTMSKDDLEHRPAHGADEEIQPARAGRWSHAEEYRAPVTVDSSANVLRPMGKSLVIVESPAKARTIEGYLGSGYSVGSSVGHVRDLPDRAKEVPETQRKRFGALGVDVDDGFEPYYVIDPGKKKIIADLKKRLADADELLLATDEDREGEAIAWHLVQVLKPKVPVKRMVFHEITKDAITRAVSETRAIDERLVDAQETRRILDRLYGYEVSPVLWKKVMPRLSAGRVQSVATRLVVDRERERMRFVAAGYWDILGTFEPGSFEARLARLDGRRIAQGRDFGESGAPTNADVLVLTEDAARSLAEALAERHVHGRERRREAVHAAARRTFPDVDAATGGEPQASVLVPDDDARRAAALRERPHHVHADRLGDAVGRRIESRACPRCARLRSGDGAGRAAALRARGRQCPGGTRGDSAGR